MKIPIAFSLKNRASSLDEDAKLLNGYVETRGDPKKGGIVYAEKRPAMDSAFELPSGTGQGIYVPNTPDGDGEPGVVIGDILTRAPTPKKKRVAFAVQPSDSALNTAISPSVTVRVLNSIGGVVTSATDAITLALFDNPTSATLGGTLTQNAVSGVATFNNLTLNRSGDDFSLRATATSLNSDTSNFFTIPTSLVFTTQPSNVSANTDFTVAVTSRDSAGNADTNFNGTVTLSLWSATGNGIPTGDFIVDAVNGVATFANISLSDGGVSGNADGTYRFVAKADNQSFVNYYIPSQVVSNSFSVATYVGTLTAAEAGGGFRFGFQTNDYGSISPTTYLTKTITELYSDTIDAGFTVFALNHPTAPQDFFTSITVNGTTLLSANATTYGAGTWQWDAEIIIPSSGSYSVAIVE